MSWHKVVMSVDDVARGRGELLLNDLEAVFVAASFPEDAAVFFEMGYTPGAIDYFNPGASRIALGVLGKWNGVPCDKPGHSVGLLIGRDGALEEHLASLPPEDGHEGAL
jgi:hypothetical protein